ncbi:hypothetical protein A3F66_05230 [candidate division TM6 bacterium RIFCSPHIGHO2_12_FULL_32_22]|nr:MAG: hypothetical protein A3F66_05230 [candidate division TM6 bacterium RIFCSPHIGHO2_12_FULL_32_22]
MKYINFVLFLNLTSYLVSDQPVLIFTYSYNRPEFIELQHKSFKKFLKDDYRFIVFSDANTTENQTAIANTCNRLGIEFIQIPQIIHDLPYLPRYEHEPSFHYPTIRCVNGIQYSLNKVGFFHKGPVLILDSDMFLIRDLSLKSLLQKYDIVAGFQAYENNGVKIKYVSVNFVLLNMNILPNKETFNVNTGIIKGVKTDAGGQTYWYFKNNPKVRVLEIHHNIICRKPNAGCLYPTYDNLKNHNFSEKEIEYLSNPINDGVEISLSQTFLHYRSGSNWDGKDQSFHQRKFQVLKEFIDSISS